MVIGDEKAARPFVETTELKRPRVGRVGFDSMPCGFAIS